VNPVDKKITDSPLRTLAVIPAAGTGLRMGGPLAKQFLELDGKPLLAVTLQPFQDCPAVDGVILVVPGASLDYCRREIVEKYGITKVRRLIPGGSRRQDSVRMGLLAVAEPCELVVIHDAARPLITVDILCRVIEAAGKTGSAVTGLPAKETVKEVDMFGRVMKTYERSRVWLVQTPQAFRYRDLMAAHEAAFAENWAEATDDACLLENMGLPVSVVEGDEENIKVTTPHDLELARFLLMRRQMPNDAT
jgi:2-C-methyl-D-erythritol 4-phosphate cytidylyltransferase